MTATQITIGGASGYWGDAPMATPQLLAVEGLDYLVYDYLAEVTMSIMARARAADPEQGYATDFVTSAMAPNLQRIAASGVKVIANAGGVNPRACAEALRKLIADQGLDLRVATVLGDDLMPRLQVLADRSGADAIREMFSGEPFPEPARVASANAYLGAFPIASALDRGADIVITGRCVDSAVTLGACIHAFGWQADDFERLAQGSLAGHILECGTQATGGNYTDWESVAHTLANAGYPLATIAANGTFEVSKPAGTGGAVTVGTVAEQMLYEIGDPQAYLLPDVSCDFSAVTLEQLAVDRVRVSGARGHGAPASYKVCVTWADGFRAGHIWTMVGRDARRKAELFAEGVFARTRALLREQGLGDFSETSVEISGVESHFGAAAAVGDVREVDIKIAVKHANPRGVGLFLKEMTGIALAAPPGLCSFAGARAKPSPVVRLFSFLLPKAELDLTVEVQESAAAFTEARVSPPEPVPAPQLPALPQTNADLIEVPLEQLAFGRSGDKGDKANIGIIARRPEYLPWIAAALTEAQVAEFFAHFLRPGQARPVERFYLPGSHALNFLLHDILGGGGVASLRTDPQGKGYAQLLLTVPVPVPADLL
ncbi:MAG: acyclic terpene utilization AtuA family protein [Haliea sp.]